MLGKADDLEQWSGQCSTHPVQWIQYCWQFRFHNLLSKTIFVSLLITTLSLEEKMTGIWQTVWRKNALKCHLHSLSSLAQRFSLLCKQIIILKKKRVNHNNHLSYDLASHNLLLLLLLSKHGLEKRIHSNWFRFLFNVITKRNVVTLVELNKHAFKDTLISSARCRCWCWCHNAIISTNRKEILFKSRFVSIQTRYVRIQKLVFIFLEKNPFRYLIFRMEYILSFSMRNQLIKLKQINGIIQYNKFVAKTQFFSY